MSTFSLKQLIDAQLDFLAYLASVTATTIDDQVVRLLAAISNSPELMEWIEGLYDSDTPPGALAVTDAPEPVRAALAAAGFDWQQVVTFLLPLALELLKRFRARRGE